MNLILRPEQIDDINYILDHPKCMMSLAMGLGKTIISLMAIKYLKDIGELRRVLIIAPLRVAKSVWRQEALKWSETQSLKIVSAIGTPRRREKAIASTSDIVVTNCEQMVWLEKALAGRAEFDMIIVDESTKFKSNKALRFKALARMSKKVNRMVLLTGTPCPNGEMDLWSQYFLLDHGKRLLSSFYAFRKDFYISDYMGYNYVLKDGAAEQIRSKVQDLTRCRELKDSTLPPILYENIYLDMTPKLKDYYKKFERDLFLEFPQDQLTAANAAVLSNKLSQFCNGRVYSEDGNFVQIHSLKIDALKDLVEDNPNEHFLVAYQFKHDLLALRDAFDFGVCLKDPDAIDKWNNNEIRMLFAHPKSAAHGLNLQFGGSVVVWFGITWALEDYLQFNKRLHRSGQTNTVRIIHLVLEDTIDSEIQSRLDSKDKAQKTFLDFMKERKIHD